MRTADLDTFQAVSAADSEQHLGVDTAAFMNAGNLD